MDPHQKIKKIELINQSIDITPTMGAKVNVNYSKWIPICPVCHAKVISIIEHARENKDQDHKVLEIMLL